MQQDYGSDIFGFGYALYTKNPKQWSEAVGKWDEHFKNAEVKVVCEFTLDRDGLITEGLF